MADGTPNCCNSYENILQSLDRSYLAMEAFSRHVQQICFNPWCRITETRHKRQRQKGPSAFDDLKSRRAAASHKKVGGGTRRKEREGKKSGQISLDSRKREQNRERRDASNDTSIGRDKLFRFSRNWISDFLPLPLEASSGSGNCLAYLRTLPSSYCIYCLQL